MTDEASPPRAKADACAALSWQLDQQRTMNARQQTVIEDLQRELEEAKQANATLVETNTRLDDQLRERVPASEAGVLRLELHAAERACEEMTGRLRFAEQALLGLAYRVGRAEIPLIEKEASDDADLAEAAANLEESLV